MFALPQPDSPAGPPRGRGGFGADRGARAGRALQPDRSHEVPTRRRDGGYPRLADAARIGRRLHLTNAAFGGRSPPTTGTPSPSRAPAPRRRPADLESIDPGQARGAIYTWQKMG